MSVCSRPQDLPGLRDRLRSFVLAVGDQVVRDKMENQDDPFYALVVEQNAYGQEQVARDAPAAYASMFDVAELFYVREEMAQLAVAAGKFLPEFTLAAEDLPVPDGFAFFETPIATDRREMRGPNGDLVPGSVVDINAVLWVTLNDTVHLTWWEDTSSHEDVLRKNLGLSEMDLAVIRARAPLNWGMEMRLPFGMEKWGFSDPDSWHNPDGPTSIPLQEARKTQPPVGWLLTLKSVWLLMQQEVSSVENAHFDRAAHRRAARENREIPAVRVIALRRSGSGTGGGGSREWHHRWLVRGHWRQQWYARRGVHRPVWIAPHIKGPDGAPVLGGEKVYDLRR